MGSNFLHDLANENLKPHIAFFSAFTDIEVIKGPNTLRDIFLPEFNLFLEAKTESYLTGNVAIEIACNSPYYRLEPEWLLALPNQNRGYGLDYGHKPDHLISIAQPSGHFYYTNLSVLQNTIKPIIEQGIWASGQLRVKPSFNKGRRWYSVNLIYPLSGIKWQWEGII